MIPSPSRRRASPGDGFTLVELLMAITIISVLAALLMPVIALTRESMLRTGCQNNQRQVLLAIEVYAREWDNLLIPASRAA